MQLSDITNETGYIDRVKIYDLFTPIRQQYIADNWYIGVGVCMYLKEHNICPSCLYTKTTVGDGEFICPICYGQHNNQIQKYRPISTKVIRKTIEPIQQLTLF